MILTHNKFLEQAVLPFRVTLQKVSEGVWSHRNAARLEDEMA